MLCSKAAKSVRHKLPHQAVGTLSQMVVRDKRMADDMSIIIVDMLPPPAPGIMPQQFPASALKVRHEFCQFLCCCRRVVDLCNYLLANRGCWVCAHGSMADDMSIIIVDMLPPPAPGIMPQQFPASALKVRHADRCCVFSCVLLAVRPSFGGLCGVVFQHGR
jgi:hypothetical protein